ncbi:hypothetical protein [Nonomuraea zeae]|uniref:hypothetical protein n=1 Tax=Nonomuraea zeae TaxID=1642303 RepID=UPI00360A3336
MEAISAADHGWTSRVLELPGWAERYRARVDSWRLPASETKRAELAHAYGADGYALVEAVYAPFSPTWLRNLPAVEALRVMLIQNYVRVTDRKGREVVQRRRPLEDGGEGLPPGRVRLTSPYDTDARWAAKGDDMFWNGYKLHISETCHTPADTNGTNIAPSHLITNVATTDATVPDSQMTEKIHQMLAARGLLPGEHYLDSGYPSAELLLSARQRFGIALITPGPAGSIIANPRRSRIRSCGVHHRRGRRTGHRPTRTGEFLVESLHPARHRSDRGQIQRRGLPTVPGSVLVHLGHHPRAPSSTSPCRPASIRPAGTGRTSTSSAPESKSPCARPSRSPGFAEPATED